MYAIRGQGYLVCVEVADSARQHGIRDEDIEHAIRHPSEWSRARGETLSSARIVPAGC